MGALLTLSSKGQLVIPARLRLLLGLQADDRLALSLEADGLRLIPQDAAKTSSVRALIGCTGDQARHWLWKQWIRPAFEGLLAIRHLHLEQDNLLRQALEAHRLDMDFVDALHLVRREGG